MNKHFFCFFIIFLLSFSSSAAEEKKSFFAKIDSARKAENAAQKEWLKQKIKNHLGEQKPSNFKILPFSLGLVATTLTIVDASKTETISVSILDNNGNIQTNEMKFKHKWTITHTTLLLLSVGLTFSGTF